MQFNRRDFIRATAAASLMGAAARGLPGTFTAHAADVSGYKALVCVFLFGGLDAQDVLIPYDQSSYDSYANIRQSLLNRYGATRARENLLPLPQIMLRASEAANLSSPHFMYQFDLEFQGWAGAYSGTDAA